MEYENGVLTIDRYFDPLMEPKKSADLDETVNDIEKLVIKDKEGENIKWIIYYITQIGFHELKELSLINNLLPDISELKYAKFEKLEKLS